MGTTLTAFTDSDGFQYCFVIAVEGYPYLLTDYRTPSDLFTSGTGWQGSGWVSALGGLSLEGVVFTQKIVPWDNKLRGDAISFAMLDYDGADQFGIDAFKRGAGSETELSSTITNTTTTIPVVSTENFDAAGFIYIGTEAIKYAGKTTDPDTFTGCTRGMYSPFLSDSAALFGRNHIVKKEKGVVPVGVKVTSIPRVWMGKWCGIYMHRVVGGVIDTRANAELIHAGKINSIQDTSNGNTVVSVSHILNDIAGGVVLYDQFIGRVKRGIFVPVGFRLRILTVEMNVGGDALQNTALLTADGTYLTEGETYELSDFVNRLDEWVQDQSLAQGLTLSLHSEGGMWHFRVGWTAGYNAGGSEVHTLHGWIKARRMIMQMLGYDSPGFENPYVKREFGTLNGELPGSTDQFLSPLEPITVRAFQGADNQTLDLEEGAGTWVEQEDLLPGMLKSLANTVAGEAWGVIKCADAMAVGKYVSNTEITNIRGVPEISKVVGLPFGSLLGSGWGEIRMSEGDELEVRQVLMLEATLKDLICTFLATTGQDAFNDTTFDRGGDLGPQMGLAVPYSLLGTTFENSISNLYIAEDKILCIIETATKFIDLFLSDLTLRGAYFVFKNGIIQAVAPQTPVASLKVHELNEDNKAAPGGVSDPNRTPTQVTSEYLRNVAKVSYNRILLDPGKYRSVQKYIYQSSVDDYGEAKAITVKARNSYSGLSFQNQIEAITTYMVAELLPAWGRPLQRLRRSIDLSLYRNIAPGDICIVTDTFARNPETGKRGITTKPAMILSHSFSVSGQMMGEVDLLVGVIDDTVIYAPTAYVDEGIANAGYTAGTPSLTCKASEYSLGTEAADASHFETNDTITIIEVSPSDPASPDSWTRTVAGVSGNIITLNSTLSSPAWDTGKQYQIFSQPYASAVATQQTDCYQADEGDLRVVNTRDPYRYGSFNTTDTVALPAATVLPHKHADAWFGDGAPLTVTAHQNIGKMPNNLVGYKTATKGAMIGAAEVTGDTAATWKLLEVYPVFVGLGPEGSSGHRNITISPFMKSTGASATYLRITISRTPPDLDLETPTSLVDTVFTTPYAQLTFTTSAATYAAITAQSLKAIYNTLTGIAFVSIEGKGSGSHAPKYWGITRFEVGAPGV